MSSVDNLTVTSRLKRKDAEPYKPEESLRFQGRKRAFDETVEYLEYSKTNPPNKDLVQPQRPSRGLNPKRATQRMPKSGPIDSPNNPFAPELAPKKRGESSKAKYTLKPAHFTPGPETQKPDLETKSNSDKMSSESHKKGMPNRRDNKAPSYDKARPEELLRYIEDVEREMERVGVVDDQTQKDWIRHYADQRSSDEWTVLETYPPGTGTYDEFKEELVSHYPEATDSLEGSIVRLDKLCAKSKPLTTENLSAMLEFIRGFKFEGRKLLDGGCISNREIVAKFLSCLDPELKRTVVWQVSQLSLKDISDSAGKGRASQPRHHTDPIEFKTLVRVLEGLVRSADSYSTITSTVTTGSGTTAKPLNRTQHTILQRPVEEPTVLSSNDRVVQLLEDLNESMAKNTDVLVNMSKENTQRHGETTKSIETVHILLNTWHKDGDRSERPGNQSNSGSSNRSSGRRDQCHYCWGPGHYIAHCESLAADVAEGKVQTLDNGTKVDFKTVPKEPSNLSPRDRVDQQWRNRRQFFAEDLPEDGIIDLIPNGLVTLQANRNARDKRDELIADLQEKHRRANEERDMWKAMMASRQSNMSAPAVPQAPQSIPQPAVAPAQVPIDPTKSIEFMSMLARMMNLSTTNQENVGKGFPKAQ